MAFGGTLCRLLLMTAAGFHARNAASDMLESTRVAFDAVEGTFMPTPTFDYDADAPPTAVFDISEMMPANSYSGADERVAFHLAGIQGAASAASIPLDDAAMAAARQNLGDLYNLLKSREVRVVTMRQGASDEEVQAALLELGAIRAREPTLLKPPRRARRRHAAA